MIKTVGITGTRYGASATQYREMAMLLKELKDNGAEVFRHGDCYGVDIEAADIARNLGYYIIKHPGPSGAGTKADEIELPLPFLFRNKVIVEKSDLLLVVPHTKTEQLRSGTWATYRYAKKIGRSYNLIIARR